MIVALSVRDVDSVIITQAVPNAKSGADLDEGDYPSFCINPRLLTFLLK